MVGKGYGRVFVAALPVMTVTRERDEIMRFLRGHAPSSPLPGSSSEVVMDTATENCSAALWIDGKPCASVSCRPSRDMPSSFSRG